MTDYFIHPSAIVETASIGAGTRIWAFAHVLPGATIGRDCNLCDQIFIENRVYIGDRVTIKSGVQLWDGITLEDDVFIGPNATFTNDPFPRSKRYPAAFSETVVRRFASIGANATILPGLVIGQNAMVGAGAVVTRDVPPHAIVVGNPARIVGYADARHQPAAPAGISAEAHAVRDELAVGGAALYHLALVIDLRGNLSYAQYPDILPFTPVRYFLVFDVPGREVRGEHAHRACHQFLVCVKGSCAVIVDDGSKRLEVRLDRPNLGLHLPPMAWATEYDFSPDAVLMVLASHGYQADDYIRSYDDFLGEIE